MKKEYIAKVGENKLIRITNIITGKIKVYNVLDFIPGQIHYKKETAEYPVYLQNNIYQQMKKYYFIS